jgi:hypothetical protein
MLNFEVEMDPEAASTDIKSEESRGRPSAKSIVVKLKIGETEPHY